jgi:hypothetical protein
VLNVPGPNDRTHCVIFRWEKSSRTALGRPSASQALAGLLEPPEKHLEFGIV